MSVCVFMRKCVHAWIHTCMHACVCVCVRISLQLARRGMDVVIMSWSKEQLEQVAKEISKIFLETSKH